MNETMPKYMTEIKKKPIWKRAGFYFQLRAGLFCLYQDHIPDWSLYFGLNGNRVLALHVKHKFTAPLSGCSGNLVTAKVSSDVSIVMHRDLQSCIVIYRADEALICENNTHTYINTYITHTPTRLDNQDVRFLVVFTVSR